MTPQERRIACAEAMGWREIYFASPYEPDLPNPDESIADAFALVEFMREKDWYFTLYSSQYWEDAGWDDKWRAQFINAEDSVDELHHQGFGPTPQQAIVSAFLNYVASTKEEP